MPDHMVEGIHAEGRVPQGRHQDMHLGALADMGQSVECDGALAAAGSSVERAARAGLNVPGGGVGIGGVLEPLQAAPVIIEDGAFIGSRCIVVEGVRIGREAVLGANVVLTASTKIIDVTGPEPITYRGLVPERCVVIPGTMPKEFAAGTYQVPCALIIGRRKESTDQKTSLNDALREFQVAV